MAHPKGCVLLVEPACLRSRDENRIEWVSFSIFNLIEFVSLDKLEFGLKFTTSNSKSEQKNGLDISPTIFYF
jgi:hypothetical protein